MDGIDSITRLRILLAVSMIFLATNSHAQSTDGQLAEFNAVYAIKKGILTIGETTRSLTLNENGVHVFESITQPKGIANLIYNGTITERSEWRYNHNLVQPLSYTYLDIQEKKPRDVHLSFDWSSGKVTNNINGDPWEMPLEPGAQDKLGYQLQLMLDLNHKPASLSYHIADGGKLKLYTVDVLAPKTLKTPVGSFEATPVRLINGKRTTTFWCAPSLHFLPILIEQYRNKSLLMTAEIISLDGMPLE